MADAVQRKLSIGLPYYSSDFYKYIKRIKS